MKITTIPHHSHPHILTFKPSKDPFTCDGCKQMGFGCSYSCCNPNCNFDLHKLCAIPINPLYHPFVMSRKMDFQCHFPNKRVCDACLRYIEGFGYRSPCGTYNLHPFCANLPRKLVIDNQDENGKVILKLTNHIRSKCLKCGEKKLSSNEKKGWSYASKCGNYCFHVPCIMQMIYETWEKPYLGYSGNSVELPPLQITKFESSSNNNSQNKKLSAKLRMVVSVLKVILTAFLGYSVAEITTEITALAHSIAANY